MASIILGIIGLLFVLLGLIPFLGLVNWIAIPLLVIGLVLGIVGTTKKKGTSIAGLVICALFLIISLIRLVVGGGIL